MLRLTLLLYLCAPARAAVTCERHLGRGWAFEILSAGDETRRRAIQRLVLDTYEASGLVDGAERARLVATDHQPIDYDVFVLRHADQVVYTMQLNHYRRAPTDVPPEHVYAFLSGVPPSAYHRILKEIREALALASGGEITHHVRTGPTPDVFREYVRYRVLRTARERGLQHLIACVEPTALRLFARYGFTPLLEFRTIAGRLNTLAVCRLDSPEVERVLSAPRDI